MTTFNTSAVNTVVANNVKNSLSVNNIHININEVKSMKIADIKKELAPQFTVEKKVVVGVKKERVATKRSKGGFQHSKVKRTPIYETKAVLDVDALDRAAKLVKAAKLTEAKEAAKAAFHARNNERAEAKSFALEMQARKNELARIEHQLALVKIHKPRKITINPKTMKTKVGAPSAGAIRNRARVERGIVNAQKAMAKFGPCCHLAVGYEYSSNPVKGVSRAEAQALLSASKVRSFVSKASSTMEVISMLDRVDSLIERALVAVATGEAFIRAAQTRLDSTLNTLPTIATTMTMQLDIDAILIAVHNQAMDDMASIHNISEPTAEQYEDAVLDCFQEVCNQLNYQLAEHEEDEILHMAANYNNHYIADYSNMDKVKAFWNNINVEEALARYNEVVAAINAEAKSFTDAEPVDKDPENDLLETIYAWKAEKLTVADYLMFEKACGYAEGVEFILTEDAMKEVGILEKSIHHFEYGYNMDLSEGPLEVNYMNDEKTELLLVQSMNAGGGDNLDKNSDNPNQPITETKEETPMSYINAESFAKASAFDRPNYAEVAPLINFNGGFINFNGEGQSMAEKLAELAFPNKEIKILANDSEEQIAKVTKANEKANAKNAEARAQFIEAFGPKLGYIVPVSLEYDQYHVFDKCGLGVKKHMESLFTLVRRPASKGGKISYSGVEFNPMARVVDLNKSAVAEVMWFEILAEATYNLTNEERAQLLFILFNSVATVDGAVVTRGEVSFDLANATVSTGNRVLKANKASCFHQFTVLDGQHAVFMLALQSLGGTEKQLQTSINLAVGLFQNEHNYGHKPDADDMAFFVEANKIFTNGVKSSTSKFPSIEIVGGKQHPNFLGYVLSKGVIATCDKTNIKFVTIGVGAEAVGVGYSRDELGRLDQMFTSNDANKPTKLFNRAAANAYSCASLPDRVASNFGFQLSDGRVARTKGKMMKVAYANSNLTFGSGVGIINPSTKIEFSIAKKEKQPLNLSTFGYKYANNSVFKTKLVKEIEDKIAEVVGESFNPKEVIVAVDFNGVKYDLVSNTEKAAKVTVTGGYVRNNVLDPNCIEVIVDVEMVGKTGFVKTRRFATKFTTVPYKAEFVGLNNEWDIILNNECTKGHGALLEMFANATGERFLNNSNQEFTTPAGDSFNVTTEDNPFYQWRDANIHKGAKLRMTIAKSVWENQARFLNSVELIEETVDSDGNPCVLVEETVDVIFGELVFDVEISSPLESVSKSNLTLESASAIYLQSKRLGEIFLGECVKKADQFIEIAKRFSNKDKAALAEVNLMDADSKNAFINSIKLEETAINHRVLISRAYKAYPNGVKFTLDITNDPCVINFGIIAAFGQFNPLNGSGISETGAVANFLIEVLSNGNNIRPSFFKASKATTKILNTALDSKNVLKKATRSGKLIYGKVRTSFHPMLHSEDGIPTVVMNINCPMVKMLGLKVDSENISNFNQFVGFARTPMPFLGGARVKLTADANICDVAHVLVDPYVWHQLNEGDSDGDGIAVINLDALGCTKQEIVELNNSIMGIAGYKHLYGENVPYADFVSEADKVGKKSFAGYINFISSKITNPDTDEKVNITREFVGDFAARVAKHYKGAVGTSYGICSKLVFHAANEAAKEDSNKLEALLSATLIAWRSLYEGLGLSGYSSKAAHVFHIIRCASADNRAGKVWQCPTTGEIDVIFAHKGDESNFVSGAKVLKEEFSFDFGAEVFDIIISSRTVTRMAVKLEGYGNISNYWLKAPGLAEAGIKYGALRRISQGDDRVAEEIGLTEEAEIQKAGDFCPRPLTRQFHTDIIVEEQFANRLLGEVAAKTCEFHNEIILAKKIKRAQEEGYSVS